ncbi:P-loop containing nucleoside triphosphate hydrolase [Pseudocohnilembus persalinus]|uniref:p-loop containing nucleoside triphosphate hydrolase n=1 Tax=Pseudocohnilembus persalinus TaxID=266149 RepID=A0A0V0QPR9_PSEPJ|nr:P-loop containing nucleoside triphosphate hydrolase [Pseudocohnilembus persalinus]|eukprot:KRX04145.1 P-loop containing nucleoside triphosphate hydrolase [Pseudocohnilembus persalinus]
MIKNMNYQRFFLIEPALKQNKNYIFEYNFKVRSCGGKGLISIGTKKKPENREKYLGHGCYMIRQDGLELNHHDVGQNLYYTQFQFNEGDEVKMTIDFNDETITYLNLNTNQRYKQYFNLQSLLNPQLNEYKMEQGKQKSKADQEKIKKYLISKKKKELEKELKSLKQDQEVQNEEKKQLQTHIQSQLNLLEEQENSLQFLENIDKVLNLNLNDEFENNKILDQSYYDDFNTLDITICGLIYDYQDQIELVGSQKQINIKQKIFDPLQINFEAQMITADCFVYDGQNQKKIDRFGFEKGDRIKLQIDLVENQLNYFNLTTKQVEQLFIFECPLCFEDLPKNKLVVTNCLHQVCTKCYDALTSQQMAVCPYCKQILDDKQVMVHPRLQRKTKSKIQMLVEQIKMIDEDDKIIVYTQFHDLTLKIANLLEETNIQYFILKGEPSEVNIRLQKFKKQPDVKVLIMSIEQAASGINIVEANHVIFVHPIFGMNREKSQITYAQCIGRAYRIGQKKKVYTNVYVTNDSIEEEAYKPFENIFMNIKKQ